MNRYLVLALAGGALLVGAPGARARTPDWLRALARAPLPDYPDDTEAVVLLDEKITTVRNTGEIKTLYRRAYKILRPQGRTVGVVRVYFDQETRLTSLKGWSIPARGKGFEVKEKDAVETSPFGGALYQDTRYKLLMLPAAEPGNVVGYEYEQNRRPTILQDRWFFQDVYPVRKARFVLQLSDGWEFESSWLNHTAQDSQATGQNRWTWELQDVSAIDSEPRMPPWQAVAGWLAVTYFPRQGSPQDKSHGSWRDVGLWYARLAAGSRQGAPEIRQKVAEITDAAPTTLDKVRALASFAQRDIRYVAIEIGIGGYQPHRALDVFANRYGDCKDKATLLSSMLREIGIESYYVLVHTSRGIVAPVFPSMLNFNHAILAIRLPDDVPTASLYSTLEHERMGRLLFFDPTDSLTPLGYLPATLQATYGLLVTEDGGELLDLPLLAPATNRLLRTGRFVLQENGDLAGEVKEIRWGEPAVSRRGILLRSKAAERQKVFENFLTGFLGGFVLVDSVVENLEESNQNLVMSYSFMADSYAKRAGDLMIVRPRVLGRKSTGLLEDEDRKYPVEFATTSLETDRMEITFPAGYRVDELPPPTHIDFGFAEYRSLVEAKGNVLHYSRTFAINDVLVPRKRLDELKQFFRQISTDEQNRVVLVRSVD